VGCCWCNCRTGGCWDFQRFVLVGMVEWQVCIQDDSVRGCSQSVIKEQAHSQFSTYGGTGSYVGCC